jgi:hypothetical protein
MVGASAVLAGVTYHLQDIDAELLVRSRGMLPRNTHPLLSPALLFSFPPLLIASFSPLLLLYISSPLLHISYASC